MTTPGRRRVAFQLGAVLTALTPLYVQAAGTDDRSSYYKAPFNLLS